MSIQSMNRCTGPVLCTCPITAPHNPANPVCPRNQPTTQNPDTRNEPLAPGVDAFRPLPGQCKNISDCTNSLECFGPTPGCRRALGVQEGIASASGSALGVPVVLRRHHPNCAYASLPDQPTNCSCPPIAGVSPSEDQTFPQHPLRAGD